LGHLGARSIFAQHDAKEVWAQHGRVVEQLKKGLNEAAKILAEAAGDILGITAFPKSVWRATGVVGQPPLTAPP
jgi:hypothetical protein